MHQGPHRQIHRMHRAIHAPYTTGTTGEMRQVLARLSDAQEQIVYLRTKLDRMEEKLDRAMDDLAAERAKATALLTDQRAASTTAGPPALPAPEPVPAASTSPAPPRRSWLPWRRG